MQRYLSYFNLIVMATLLLAASIHSEIPHVINYQGRLLDSEGMPINDVVDMIFRIYDQEEGGNQLWYEEHLVAHGNGIVISNGLFNVILGSLIAIPDTVFNGPDRWLDILVTSPPALSPRTKLTSMAYSYRAQIADSTKVGGGWKDNGTVINLNSNNDSVGIGTTTPSTKLTVKQSTDTNPPDGISIESSDGYSAVICREAGVEGALIIRNDGNNTISVKGGAVGIATTEPDNELTVQGNAHITNDLIVDGIIYASQGVAGIVPIGSIVAWIKSYPNTPSLPDNFVECNGQTLNDTDSPYNGLIIPNLNGTTEENKRFLRGATTSGTTGGAATHTHSLVQKNWGCCSTTYDPVGVGDNIPPFYEVVWIIRVK